ncbi:Sterol desaturase/sphingolipid hydroxylase, fatty acid hydroxylase superfamily [Thermomonospora echinospora]|uniref:Sterol desaturase/sphingolipid hydroxylase, fatty acid hydroxylase superfamily n=1 Tax=Thermomonospora echinospora TaxID=1992 RepID=A0A1H6DJ44_9ACTN|nr:sterol desaturase family protein [Thermomonospora echinospora]SEG84715.1 Sterol desaturase/sphingolipid hydroxylase, fatty acid hydroxylase superfamily [Thermomonospora echinospora]
MSTTTITTGPLPARAVRTAVRYGYVPAMLLGVNGAAIALTTAGATHGAGKVWLLVLLAAAIAASFAAEHLLPYESDWNRPLGDGRRDAAHTLVNETLILGSLAAIPALAAAVTVADTWPHHWPLWAQVLAAILAADAGITLVHYASHKIGMLWRFHAVHHSVKRFYGLNGLMKHPLHQTIEMTAGITPLLAVGLPVDVASALALAVAAQLLLQHSNADYRIGPAKHVLALNEGHRFHHLKWAGIGDVNFGLFTLIWDHALRTYSYDGARRFTSDDLGMAAKPHYPVRYLAQLAEPFKTSGACTTSPATGTAGTAALEGARSRAAQ